MGKFDLYKIPLKSLTAIKQEFTYVLNDKFFNDIDSEEFKKGNVNATVTVKKITGTFELAFVLEGIAKVPCDRCLDDVEVSVDYQGKIFVKFGKTYSEESDDIIIIPEEEGELNIAWFLYEFVALSLPMKRVHLPGKCNKTVSEKLRKHIATDEDDENSKDSELGVGMMDEGNFDKIEEKETDPRWDKLKDIQIEE